MWEYKSTLTPFVLMPSASCYYAIGLYASCGFFFLFAQRDMARRSEAEHPGETITIEREVKHKVAAQPGRMGRAPFRWSTSSAFRYPAQTGQIIEWRSTKLGPRGTYAELPLVLDISANKTWYVFTKIAINEGCRRYVKYQFQNGVWTEPMLTEAIEPHPTNLFLAAGSNEIEGLISLVEKARENSSSGYTPDLKQVGPKRVICGY
ncbi:MAG: hypothetical protein IPG66_00475 [Hydrogenophilales bacterium]|nr:hypothetical protein [Hydrogenophilales bacterium]